MLNENFLKYWNESHKINNNATKCTQEKSVGAMGYGKDEREDIIEVFKWKDTFIQMEV